MREGKATASTSSSSPTTRLRTRCWSKKSCSALPSRGRSSNAKRSASIGDGVSRTEVDRTPDRNAAEAAKRVVGVTIVDGRFVYVRGLGERYTNALLNGAPLPSPEPDRQTVALDLFPTKVLEGITIKKQFLPDMPGDFAGGSVLIQTRDFPRKAMFQVTLGTGFDTSSTFRERPAQRGSGTDFLGFDSGLRQPLRRDPARSEARQHHRRPRAPGLGSAHELVHVADLHDQPAQLRCVDRRG